jgi:sugar (pentulose or hexulose) kinase
LNVTEAACLGAAMLACAADTGEPLTKLAARWVAPAGRIFPSPGLSDHYRRRFADYRQLHAALRRLLVATPAGTTAEHPAS